VTSPARLITIALSHYCEKARWGLDRVALPYREEPHVPLLHRLATMRNDGGTVPLLVHGDNRLVDSTAILVHADAVRGGELLYPRDPALRREVDALEERFDTKLGPHTRRWGYAHLLQETGLLRKLWSHGAPRLEGSLLPLLVPIARRLVRMGYRVSPDSGQRSLERVRRVFREVDELLSDGRRFLVGNRFTAADLTFAALAGAVLMPPEYSVPLPQPDELPAEMASVVRELRAHPAGAHGLAMFRDERRPATRASTP
jgi:glutathione S-transferase